MKKLLGLMGSALLLMTAASPTHGEVRLHPLISDDMVLQRDRPIAVWGEAAPGEQIEVAITPQAITPQAITPQAITPQKKMTIADEKGNWRLGIGPLPAARNLSLRVKGTNEIILKNVAVGDVWICSGQSNLEWPLSHARDAQAEIAGANHPDIRVFTVPKRMAGRPQTDFAVATRWEVCSPKSATQFSAVAYFFGRELNQKLKVPIGLISATWGGTIIQAWMSPDALRANNDLREASEKITSYFAAVEGGARLEDVPGAPADLLGNANQLQVLFNGMIAPLRNFKVRGVIWYQGEGNAGQPAQYRTLFPDLIRDWRSQWGAKQDGSEFGFYFVQLASFRGSVPDPVQSGWAEMREAQATALKLPRTGMATAIDIGEANDIHPTNKQDVGKRLALAALAIDYKLPVEYSGPVFHIMQPIPNTNRVRIYFTHAKGLTVNKSPPVITPRVQPQTAEYPDVPFEHWGYNAINRLVAVGIIEQSPTGNSSRPMTRYEFAVAIIEPLRNQSDLNKPIKFLAQTPVEVRNLYLALGREFDNELRALGIAGDFSEETFLLQKPIIKGFAIRGEDGHWHYANAQIENDTVVVWSDFVPQPVAVRYGWANNPDVNLINGAGLPAVPFRTDALP